MYSFISLEIKCPECNHSLMNENKKIDNKPSVETKISIGGNKGFIWLSSIYGSYNYDSEIEIDKGDVGNFYCPHCNSELISEKTCSDCNAHLIPLNLQEGGMVHICSRAGCKKHSIEFEDLTTTLRHFHREFGYTGEFKKKKMPPKDVACKSNSQKEIISSGTFLYAYCPHCQKSLIDGDTIELTVINKKDEEGLLHLSPYLDSFEHKTTIQLPEQKKVNDIKCIHCGTSLIEEDKNCGKCESELVRIQVAARSKMIDFYLCSKKGCDWHGLSEQDLKDIEFESNHHK